ncbi:MAG TPA: PH domain-containing protein [Opitutaceae bacterium]|nr:PH domain-containing protein [Opitutaceae bacterium]
MPPPRTIPDFEFAPAPLGTRVRLTTLLSLVAVVILGAVIAVLVAREPHPPPWPVFLVAGIAPAIVALICVTARIQCYRIAGDELQIALPFRRARFPLGGLQSATPDREALRGARKIVGNDGLRAISGRFRSKRLGRFHAYVTDPGQTVVLRWPDRCLVVSPQHPSLFVETVRRRAGLTS